MTLQASAAHQRAHASVSRHVIPPLRLPPLSQPCMLAIARPQCRKEISVSVLGEPSRRAIWGGIHRVSSHVFSWTRLHATWFVNERRLDSVSRKYSQTKFFWLTWWFYFICFLVIFHPVYLLIRLITVLCCMLSLGRYKDELSFFVFFFESLVVQRNGFNSYGRFYSNLQKWIKCETVFIEQRKSNSFVRVKILLSDPR